MISTQHFDPPAPVAAAPETPKQPMRNGLFHSIGVVTVVVASCVFAVVLLLVHFSLTYCSSAPPSAGEVWRARGIAALAGLIWVSIPATMGLVARRTDRHSGSWLVVASTGAVLAGLISISMSPSEFCLF